jgi:hypothetical protein
VNQKQLVNCLGLAGVVIALVAQPVQADTVKVTAIELKPTRQGIEIVLKTRDSKPLQIFASSYRNTFIELPFLAVLLTLAASGVYLFIVPFLPKKNLESDRIAVLGEN